jgi:hypothetical protein
MNGWLFVDAGLAIILASVFAWKKRKLQWINKIISVIMKMGDSL